MNDKVVSLGEALPMEQARVRELIKFYVGIGIGGQFAVAVMGQALERTEKAVMAGDLVEMIRSYEELKGFE